MGEMVICKRTGVGLAVFSYMHFGGHWYSVFV